MSIHILSRTGMEIEVNDTAGFCLGLGLAMGFPEAVLLFFRGRHRFCHVLINAIHDSDPRNGIVLK